MIMVRINIRITPNPTMSPNCCVILILVKARDLIDQGQIIGKVGNYDNSGPNLYFEIWKDKQSIDPLNYFPEYKQTDLTSSNG